MMSWSDIAISQQQRQHLSQLAAIAKGDTNDLPRNHLARTRSL